MKTRPEVDFSSPLCQPYEVRQGEHGVLLMHGFAGSAAHMRPLAEGLVQQGFGVRTINLPGHATTLEDMRRCSWQDWLNAAKEAFREMKEQYRFGYINNTYFTNGYRKLWPALPHNAPSIRS